MIQGLLGQAIVGVAADLNPLTAGLRTARSLVSSTMSGIAGTIRESIGTALGLVLGDMALQLRDGLTGMVKQGISFNAEMETMKAGFEVMLGSADKANKLIKDMLKFAAETPFEMENLAGLATQLMATGKVAEDDLIPTIRKIGDAASASAKGFGAIPRVGLAISQMFQKGKVGAQDMRQLAEAGIPAWDALAEKMGISVAEVQKLSAQGKLGEQSVLDLIDAIGGRFEGMMEKQSHTFTGLGMKIRDNINIALGKISEPIFNRMKNVSEKIVALMDSPAFDRGVAKIASMVDRAMSALERGIPIVIDGIMKLVDHIKFLMENWRLVWEYAIAQGTFALSYLYDQFKYTLNERLPFSIAAVFEGLVAGAVEFGNQFESIFEAIAYFAHDTFEAFWNAQMVRLESFGKVFEKIKAGKLGDALEEFFMGGNRADRAFMSGMGKAASEFDRNIAPAAGAVANAVSDAMGKVMAAMPGFEESSTTAGLRARAGGLFDALSKAREEFDKRKSPSLLDKLLGSVDFMKQFLPKNRTGGGIFDSTLDSKKRKPEFVGIAELGQKIQQSLVSSEMKDRKAMVKATEKAAKAGEKTALSTEKVEKAVMSVGRSIVGAFGFGD